MANVEDFTRWMLRDDELDDIQYEVKNLKIDNMLVKGCAGSGKTILALHKLKSIVDNNQGSCLMVVYTITLANFVRDGLYALDINPDLVCHYHELKKIKDRRYDYIIIDEVQDFSEEMLDTVLKMTKKNVLLFGDDQQQIFNFRKDEGLSLEKIRKLTNIRSNNVYVLEKNYRLPENIAKFSEQIIDCSNELSLRCHVRGGQKPLVYLFKNIEAELSAIMNLIDEDDMKNVGILVKTNDEVIEIKEILENANFNFEYKYWDKKVLCDTVLYSNTLPKLMTYHSAKGLQFEFVFLVECNVDYDEENFHKALYVAATRPTRQLTVSSNVTYNLSPLIKDIENHFYDSYDYTNRR